MLDAILSQTVNGLVLGFLFILISIGLSIVFGLLGIVNVAHGAFFALGAYFALTLQRQFGWPPWCSRPSASALGRHRRGAAAGAPAVRQGSADDTWC